MRNNFPLKFKEWKYSKTYSQNQSRDIFPSHKIHRLLQALYRKSSLVLRTLRKKKKLRKNKNKRKWKEKKQQKKEHRREIAAKNKELEQIKKAEKDKKDEKEMWARL